MNIAGLDRALPLCPLNESLMIAGFDNSGATEINTACAKQLLDRAPEYDYIITAEAKGIPLAHEMARLAGNQKYLVARKYPKLYMTGVFEAELRSITTDKVQKLYLDTADAELIKGKRVLIVDDVVSLGESLAAVEHLVKLAGAEVVGKMFILAEGNACKRDDIIYLEELPLFDKNGNKI